MKKINLILLFCCSLMILGSNAEAKWWIFGQESEPVSMDYLYANTYNFDDFENGITLYQDASNNEIIHIRGKATADKGMIGKVLVTINGKKDWKKAQLSKDGSFDFTFQPENTIKYDVYVKAIDTTGRTNDIELTHKIITISHQDVRALILHALSSLSKAYEENDSTSFMTNVSENFAGDDVTLASAVRRDFSLLDDISLDLTINNIASQDGKYYVSITYNRRVTVINTGEVLTDDGITEFDFSQSGKGIKLYAMKIPLIFGLSDAENVATGSLGSVENGHVITIDSSGNVKKATFAEAVNGTSSTSETGTFTLSYDEGGATPISQGFLFADGTTENIGDPTNPTTQTDIYLESNIFWTANSALIQYLGVDGSGTVNFSSMSVPTTGYGSTPVGAIGVDDHVYAVKLSDNTYALIKVISSSMTTDASSNLHSTVTCQYKYRSDGGQDF